MLFNCLAVGIGGFIGSVLRYLISLIPVLHKGSLPAQTLLVNIAGAILIGFLVKTADDCSALDERLMLFLKVGICGGFTTFSTFSLETFSMIEEGKWMLAGAYIVASVILCLLGVLAGSWMAGWIRVH